MLVCGVGGGWGNLTNWTLTLRRWGAWQIFWGACLVAELWFVERVGESNAGRQGDQEADKGCGQV